MKYLFLLFIASFAGIVASSQNNVRDTVFQLKTFPDNGLLLNRGWTFYTGDDSACRNYDYEGKNGVSVNPALLLDQLPVVKESGLGWLRLKLQVDSSLRNKAVGVTLSMLGASEIFLNGKPVISFGRGSKNYEEERTEAVFATSFNLLLGESEKQILAVRYSYHPENLYLKTGVIPMCFRLRIYPANQSIDSYSLLVKRNYLFIGIIVTIDLAAALLTLIFFFYYPSRREYLYYGLYFALQFLGMLMQMDFMGAGKTEKLSANEYILSTFAVAVLQITATLFYLNGMYKLLSYRRTKFYYFLFAYALLALVAVHFLPPWGGIFPFLFVPLTCFEILPAYYKAARRKFRGAWILFLSVLICAFILGLIINAIIRNDEEAISMLLGIGILSPALGLVIFLALDFAGISLALKKRVQEVEELSIKTVEQERQKQEIITGQKEKLEEEVQLRTQQLSKSLDHLKTTQAQLIQSEKMASLGELTAGIAHEIQNPLNFVNNFSEVSAEMMEEAEGRRQEAEENSPLVAELLLSIKENLSKINHHGKRADAIVKGMMQHSHNNAGERVSTDINELAEEYLRLAYHGYRGKDHGFQVELKTNFASDAGEVHIIPQDVGRVLLNLYNNAFYYVHEKSRLDGAGYEPKVEVSTERNGDIVQLTVRDNGIGIPEKIISKIFQPFFTTKPTGQGTGLGLSLSYDIIKSNGGSISVKSVEGEGSEFIVHLNIES